MNETYLKDLAQRTGVLVQELPQYRAILDVAAGAVFALFRANALGYKHRDGQLSDKYLQNLVTRLQKMGRGQLPQKHGWLAGFYFNSAIQRIAAAGEQLAGILGRLDRQAKRKGEEANTANISLALDQIRAEVNRFKHDETGLEKGREVTPSLAVEGLFEIIQTLETHKERLMSANPQSRRR